MSLQYGKKVLAKQDSAFSSNNQLFKLISNYGKILKNQSSIQLLYENPTVFDPSIRCSNNINSFHQIEILTGKNGVDYK